jgi:hypothetical protein
MHLEMSLATKYNRSKTQDIRFTKPQPPRRVFLMNLISKLNKNCYGTKSKS